MLDDGKTGTMMAIIRVNGVIVASAPAAEAFGVATVAIKIRDPHWRGGGGGGGDHGRGGGNGPSRIGNGGIGGGEGGCGIYEGSQRLSDGILSSTSS